MPDPDEPTTARWTLLGDEPALETPWFSIARRTYRTPNGSTPTYYVHHTHDSVLCVCVTDDARVLVERQYRPAIDRVSVDYPAGRVEADDLGLEAAMLRELEEETGYRAVELSRLGRLDQNPGFSSTSMHVFLARGVVDGVVSPDDNESIHAEFVPAAEVLGMVEQGEISCAFCVSATLLAFRALGWLSGGGLPPG